MRTFLTLLSPLLLTSLGGPLLSGCGEEEQPVMEEGAAPDDKADCTGCSPYGKWSPIADALKTQNDGGLEAFWTGTEMILWSSSGSYATKGGAAYNPTTNSWRALPLPDSPGAVTGASVAWSGKELYVFGGYDRAVNFTNAGYKYDPVTNKWTALSLTEAPSPRYWATLVWAGDRLLAFGGIGASVGPERTGAEYFPQGDYWVPIPSAPGVRVAAKGFWTGTEALFWGGNTKADLSLDAPGGGWLYNPKTQAWRAVSSVKQPAGRVHFASAWTGTELLIWGGTSRSSRNGELRFNDGARYNPRTDVWTPLPATGMIPRYGASGVFSGGEFMVFGGWGAQGNGTVPLPTGSRYSLAKNAWTSMTQDKAIPKADHAAVWTGSSMMVWGGYDDAARAFSKRGNIWRP